MLYAASKDEQTVALGLPVYPLGHATETLNAQLDGAPGAETSHSITSYQLKLVGLRQPDNREKRNLNITICYKVIKTCDHDVAWCRKCVPPHELAAVGTPRSGSRCRQSTGRRLVHVTIVHTRQT